MTEDRPVGVMVAAVVLWTLLALFLLLTEGPTRADSPKPSASPTAAPTAKATVKAKAKAKRKHHHASRSAGRWKPHTPAMRYAIGLVPARQWPCLAALWNAESGWSPTSDNPTSSAYGIPQILGLSPDLTPQQQVDRGLSYIRHRYGTPCAAWTYHKAHGWY